MYNRIYADTITLRNLFCNLSRNFAAPLQHKWHETLRRVTYHEMHLSRNVFVVYNAYFSPLLRQQKKLQDMLISKHVIITLGSHSCNLCRNKIARQVARKIAQRNSALSQQENKGK